MPREDDIAAGDTAIGDTIASRSASEILGGPSTIAERYDVLGLLGMGGMGRVYRARDRRLDEIVAIKIVRRELLDQPGVLERFRQEVKLARRVTSEHVVRTFDLGQHGDDHFLTMEYVEGRSLTRVLEDGVLSIPEALRIARSVCAGIAAAHAAGVLHRDLKPDNVLVATSGRIAITDFGIAQLSSDPLATGDRLIGTPAYMAPEQLEGLAIGPPADVYAFGTILFEMLAGRRPFVAPEAFAAAIARLREPAPDLRRSRPVSDGLAALVARCLAREPERRFADAGALLQPLAQLDLAEATGPIVPVRPIVPTSSSRGVAVLPLRAAPELAELAEGLGEEIVDGLSMTRDLRVRPMTSVRAATVAATDTDPQVIGKTLGVDVIVEGTLKRFGDQVRITARMIGVIDGFQLWANRFETRSDGLLVVGDEIARAVARALTVELVMPARGASDPRAIELYLEGKAKLRASWTSTIVGPGVENLEAALRLAPADPGILAALAMGLARLAFGGRGELLSRARMLADRALELAPESGDACLAVALTRIYRGEIVEGLDALIRAVSHVPGHAMAQAVLGAHLLEAGAMAEAVVHLEAAISLDPLSPAYFEAARAYMYQGRPELAFALLQRSPDSTFADITEARFRTWLGEPTVMRPVPEDLPDVFRQFSAAMSEVFATRTLSPASRARLDAILAVANPRLQAAIAQFSAEAFMIVGEPDRALEVIETGLGGLHDYLWISQCPLLVPLREAPRFIEISEILRGRAERVRAMLAHGL